MSEHVVIVTGSRAWSSRPVLYAALDDVLAGHVPLTVRHGAGGKADMAAQAWAVNMSHAIPVRGVTPDPRPADWHAPCRPECQPGHRRRRAGGRDYCPAAGTYRNGAMVDDGADECLAFIEPGLPCRGTVNCAERALAAVIPVRFWCSAGDTLGTREPCPVHALAAVLDRWHRALRGAAR